MKKYKFVTIEFADGSYLVYNNKYHTLLGQIVHYPQWRAWVLEPDPHTIWSTDCLEDVIDFIKNEIPKEKS